MAKVHYDGWITQHELRERSKVMPSGCWEWQSRKDKNGYGWLFRHYRYWRAHRISYFLFKRNAPLDVLVNPKLFVCHKCDNPSCINPRHLFLGNAQTNVDDAIAKKRWCVGEKHGNAKLTENDVREIRYLFESGLNKCRLAFTYSVSRATIRQILNGRKWKHVA